MRQIFQTSLLIALLYMVSFGSVTFAVEKAFPPDVLISQLVDLKMADDAAKMIENVFSADAKKKELLTFVLDRENASRIKNPVDREKALLELKARFEKIGVESKEPLWQKEGGVVHEELASILVDRIIAKEEGADPKKARELIESSMTCYTKVRDLCRDSLRHFGDNLPPKVSHKQWHGQIACENQGRLHELKTKTFDKGSAEAKEAAEEGVDYIMRDASEFLTSSDLGNWRLVLVSGEMLLWAGEIDNALDLTGEEGMGFGYLIIELGKRIEEFGEIPLPFENLYDMAILRCLQVMLNDDNKANDPQALDLVEHKETGMLKRQALNTGKPLTFTQQAVLLEVCEYRKKENATGAGSPFEGYLTWVARQQPSTHQIRAMAMIEEAGIAVKLDASSLYVKAVSLYTEWKNLEDPKAKKGKANDVIRYSGLALTEFMNSALDKQVDSGEKIVNCCILSAIVLKADGDLEGAAAMYLRAVHWYGAAKTRYNVRIESYFKNILSCGEQFGNVLEARVLKEPDDTKKEKMADIYLSKTGDMVSSILPEIPPLGPDWIKASASKSKAFELFREKKFNEAIAEYKNTIELYKSVANGKDALKNDALRYIGECFYYCGRSIDEQIAGKKNKDPEMVRSFKEYLGKAEAVWKDCMPGFTASPAKYYSIAYFRGHFYAMAALNNYDSDKKKEWLELADKDLGSVMPGKDKPEEFHVQYSNALFYHVSVLLASGRADQAINRLNLAIANPGDYSEGKTVPVLGKAARKIFDEAEGVEPETMDKLVGVIRAESEFLNFGDYYNFSNLYSKSAEKFAREASEKTGAERKAFEEKRDLSLKRSMEYLDEIVAKLNKESNPDYDKFVASVPEENRNNIKFLLELKIATLALKAGDTAKAAEKARKPFLSAYEAYNTAIIQLSSAKTSGTATPEAVKKLEKTRDDNKIVLSNLAQIACHIVLENGFEGVKQEECLNLLYNLLGGVFGYQEGDPEPWFNVQYCRFMLEFKSAGGDAKRMSTLKYNVKTLLETKGAEKVIINGVPLKKKLEDLLQ